jgi:hypothetical protein
MEHAGIDGDERSVVWLRMEPGREHHRDCYFLRWVR